MTLKIACKPRCKLRQTQSAALMVIGTLMPKMRERESVSLNHRGLKTYRRGRRREKRWRISPIGGDAREERVRV
jgi:hypothetical protein